MQTFEYYNPAKIVFGRQAEQKAGALLAAYGVKKAALLYGGASAEKSGLLDRLRASMKESGIVWCELGGIKPNPTCQSIRHYAQLCAQEGADFLLAVSGGSVIDSTKAIAVAVANPEADIWEIMCGRHAVHQMLPVGAVVTIAGT